MNREIHANQRALVDEVVEILLRSDRFRILRGITTRNTKRKSVSLQQLHGLLYLGIRTLTTTAIGCLFETFGANGGNEVLHANHFLAERFVDKRTVGKREEHAIGMASRIA